MAKRVSVSALCVLLSCAFAARAAGAADVANPSALDRRWVYLHLYKPMDDEALYSKMKGVWDLLPRDLGIAYWRVDSREKGLP